MYWKDAEPDVRVAEIWELFNKIGSLPLPKKWATCRSMSELLIKSSQEPVITITETCKHNLYAGIQSSDKELGGLLLGKAYSLPYTPNHGYRFISFITDSIPSLKFKNSAVSLAMDTEIWGRTTNYLDIGKIVIGWYHSHPNMGAFFSHTDQLTQKASFNNDYSLGVVIDPCRNEIECYFGGNSIKIAHKFGVIPDQLALLCLTTSNGPTQ